MKDPKEKALSLLKNRDKTECEMRDALEKNQFSPDQIDDTVFYLKDMGYIDDEAYAYKYVEMSMDKRRGPLRIVRELEMKGIPRDVIDDAIEETMEDQWEWDIAEAIAEDIKHKNSSLSDEKILAKIVNKLSYEGFSEEIINEIAEEF